jgi:hypothetical protein
MPSQVLPPNISSASSLHVIIRRGTGPPAAAPTSARSTARGKDHVQRLEGGEGEGPERPPLSENEYEVGVLSNLRCPAGPCGFTHMAARLRSEDRLPSGQFSCLSSGG